MIKWILTIVCTGVTIVAAAQQQTTYFDKYFKPVSEKNAAVYFRVVQYDGNDSSAGTVQYRYITGQLEGEGKNQETHS